MLSRSGPIGSNTPREVVLRVQCGVSPQKEVILALPRWRGGNIGQAHARCDRNSESGQESRQGEEAVTMPGPWPGEPKRKAGSAFFHGLLAQVLGRVGDFAVRAYGPG